MERSCTSYLVEWLHASDRVPMVIRGARQVGKTWIVRHLADREKRRLIEINFEDHPEHMEIFASNDPQEILFELKAVLQLPTLELSNSILFLDEIQVMPELYAKLRWFAEKMAELPVIAAGSLLELALLKHPMSAPVGRVTMMYLEPLSFDEFLLACDRPQLVEAVKRFTWQRPMPPRTHAELVTMFKAYLIVGGMPKAVASWSQERSIEKVSRIHHDIIKTYRDDFHKYSDRIPVQTLDTIMQKVPFELGNKFMYSKIEEGTTHTTKKAFYLLCKAGVCHQGVSTAANGVPLGAEVNEKFIKAIFIDVGLCSAALGLSLHDIKSIDELSLINDGGIAEQVVGQLLRTIRACYVEPHLYYWQRTDSRAEVDYVIQHGTNVVPIEVKAGARGKLRSLHVFMDLKKRPLAVRVCSAPPEIYPVEVKNYTGQPIRYELRSIPFYLIGELPRLLSHDPE